MIKELERRHAIGRANTFTGDHEFYWRGSRTDRGGEELETKTKAASYRAAYIIFHASFQAYKSTPSITLIPAIKGIQTPKRGGDTIRNISLSRTAGFNEKVFTGSSSIICAGAEGSICPSTLYLSL